MLKMIGMLVAVFVLAITPPVQADGLEGAWSLEVYEFQKKDVPVSGIMIFADGHFSLVYKMDFEGLSGRSHGGKYSLDGDQITYTIPWWVEHVAGKSQVMEDEVEAKGRVEILGDRLVISFENGSIQRLKKLSSGDAGNLAGAWLVDEARDQPGLVHIRSSETTVVLPENPGRGGRCQALALAAALNMLAHETMVVLAAGTDGTDGPGDVAGALVDSDTVARGQLSKLNALDCLQAADAGRFLDASGDLLRTGPTGTNVMDLLITWCA